MHLVQILNGHSKDSLIILTSCRIRALAYYLYTMLSTNAKITPQHVKNIIEDFHTDPRNSDFNLSLGELLVKLKEVDNNEEWKEIVESVQNLYQTF
ncbi:hypothetical protein MTP99_017453 [Tenebrio molitor]|jgi:hypothetical protein|nr:hypothetical protein MTP99_017453 [Tenebrio molitor]